MQPLAFEHFSSNDHNGFLEDCSISLIDKTDGANPTRRGILEKRFKDCYSLQVEHDRFIVSFGQIYKLMQDFVYFSRGGRLHHKRHTSDIFYQQYLFVSLVSIFRLCCYQYHCYNCCYCCCSRLLQHFFCCNDFTVVLFQPLAPSVYVILLFLFCLS